ncbi:MAG: hypothetical protein Q9168_006171, partial [Polycauliona sp. 1 TL-2023]
MFSKLVLRALPNHYKPDSIYAHMPMTIPSETKLIMKDLGREQDYSFDRPTFIPTPVKLTSYRGAKYVLEHGQQFKVTSGEGIGYLMGKGGLDFMLSDDSKLHARQKQTMCKALYQENSDHAIKDFFEHITLTLLHEKSYKLAGLNMVDLTRDVGNLALVHFAADIFSLPLKTSQNQHGVFSEHELYMILATIFKAIYLDSDPAESFALRHAARAVSQQLGKLIEANVHSVSSTGIVSGVVDRFRENHNPLSDYGIHMIRRLLDSGLGASEVTWSQILPTAVNMVPIAQQFTQILDYYLSEPGKQHLPEIQKYAKMDSPEGDARLTAYVMEGMRLSTPTATSGVYRESTVHETINDDNRQVTVKPGDRIYCSF